MCVYAVGGLSDSRATPLFRMVEERGRNEGRWWGWKVSVLGNVEGAAIKIPFSPSF